MAKFAAELLIERLIQWGVDTVFGYPGDGVNALFEALRTRQDQLKFIQVRHEEAAAYAACGYAKYTGKLGVCLATSGPGGIHLLNGLYDAKCDGQPVLAITGHTFHDLRAIRSLASICSRWTSRCTPRPVARSGSPSRIRIKPRKCCAQRSPIRGRPWSGPWWTPTNRSCPAM